MDILFDYYNIRGLIKIIDNIPIECKKVFASIAFSTSDYLLKKIIKNKIEFYWWGLFDHKISTKPDLLEEALKYKYLIKFFPIKQNFHAKIIYFENYGLYIGSSNMTRNALYNNIEAGVFFDSNDIAYFNILPKIEEYFNYLENKFPVLTDSDLNNYKNFLTNNEEIINNKEKENLKELFNKLFGHLPYNDSAVVSTKDKKEYNSRYKNNFVSEWRKTLNELLGIMKYFTNNLYYPKWINKKTHPGIIADQFLHAYYYSKILDYSKEDRSYDLCKNYYKQNKDRKEEALDEALNWWKKLNDAPSDEDIHINEWAVINFRLLSQDKIRNLTLEELIQLYLHNHSIRNHARQINKQTLNLPIGEKASIEECTIAFAKYHYNKISKNGLKLLEIYHYLIWNENEAIEERIFKIINDDDYYIPHLGQSVIGELIGWARPNEYPIRNNRVNKALLALGIDVRVFSY